MKYEDIAKIDEKIARLQGDLEQARQERISILEEGLRETQDALVGGARTASAPPVPRRAPARRAGAPAKVASTKRSAKPRAGKRLRRSSQDVEQRLIDTVKSAGPEGISLIEASKQSGVSYQTTLKKLREMDVFTKKGQKKGARYSYNR